MDEFDKFIEEHGDVAIHILLSDLALIMGRDVTKVVDLDDLLESKDSVEFQAKVALLELLINFCGNLLEDIYDASNLEIEDTDGGNT